MHTNIFKYSNFLYMHMYLFYIAYKNIAISRMELVPACQIVFIAPRQGRRSFPGKMNNK